MPGTTPKTADLRADPRKAMFVAAELFVGVASVPVKVRNMSAMGALIEGPGLPPEGTAVRLVRGPLSASGRVSWAASGRGGIALAAPIGVDDWIRGKLPDHQARVDALIAEIRLSGREPASVASSRGPTDRSVEEELRALATLIGGLEDALIDDPHVIARHGEALQKIDQAQQRIAALVDRFDR